MLPKHALYHVSYTPRWLTEEIRTEPRILFHHAHLLETVGLLGIGVTIEERSRTSCFTDRHAEPLHYSHHRLVGGMGDDPIAFRLSSECSTNRELTPSRRWSAWRESNPQFPAPEAGGLPASHHAVVFVPAERIERSSSGPKPEALAVGRRRNGSRGRTRTFNLRCQRPSL